MDVRERLRRLSDADADLERLISAYLSDDSNDYERYSEELFRAVREQRREYRDHDPVLGLSFGGSNTKLILASTEGGTVRVHHLRALHAPAEKIHLYDLLDQLFLEDPAVRAYLQGEKPVLSVVIPVMIGDDGIPQHPAKMPNIDGLLARTPADFVPAMNFRNNMERYFKSRNMKMPWLYYQSDPIAAHIGGVSLMPDPTLKTFLLVCGTGMATADDHVSRTISRTPIMTMDEELFPGDSTEGHLYENTCSGLLFHGLMQRVIRLRRREKGSALAAFRAEDFFESSDDSALICRLWEAAFDPDAAVDLRVQAVRDVLSEEAFAELTELAEILMHRLHITLGNAMVATAVKMNRDFGFSPYRVLFEGSVALNRHNRPLLIAEAEKRLKNKALFEKLGVPVPILDLGDYPTKPVIYDASVDETARESVEISLIGTAVLGIADEAVHRGR